MLGVVATVLTRLLRLRYFTKILIQCVEFYLLLRLVIQNLTIRLRSKKVLFYLVPDQLVQSSYLSMYYFLRRILCSYVVILVLAVSTGILSPVFCILMSLSWSRLFYRDSLTSILYYSPMCVLGRLISLKLIKLPTRRTFLLDYFTSASFACELSPSRRIYPS